MTQTHTPPSPVASRPRAGARLRARMYTVRLYVITAAEDSPERTLEVVRAACAGGAGAVQLRCKEDGGDALRRLAGRCRELTAAAGVLFIVNDHLDVAMEAAADGVHLGQDDAPIARARQLWPGRLVGRSTHSLAQALEAQEQGADYLGVGPIYATPTKPGRAAVGLELVSAVAPRLRIPWVAIGGIDATSLPLVLAAGARRVAVVRAVCAAPDPAAATAGLLRAVEAAAA
ncbi:MAG TPA: thiamine phosphate synthase [Candidatus Dormibacteraeota bacterium]